MILSEIVAEVPRSECQKFGVLETVAMATVRLLLKSFTCHISAGGHSRESQVMSVDAYQQGLQFVYRMSFLRHIDLRY